MTGALVFACKFRVTPCIAFVTALLVLVIATPFTVRLALLAETVSERFCVPVGSFDNRELIAESPLTATVMLLLTPDEEESANLYGVPLPSLIILAVTPIFALLMASLMPESVLFVLSIVTVLAPPPLFVKVAPALYAPVLAFNVPLIVPKLNVSVVLLPLPIAVVELAWPAVTNCCALAIEVTLTL